MKEFVNQLTWKDEILIVKTANRKEDKRITLACLTDRAAVETAHQLKIAHPIFKSKANKLQPNDIGKQTTVMENISGLIHPSQKPKTIYKTTNTKRYHAN